MKVILVTDTANIDGGISHVAINSALACASKGIPVHFVAACGPVAADLLQVNNIKVTCLNQKDIKSDESRFRAATQGILNFRINEVLKEIFQDQNPKETVVHFHSWSKAVSPFPIRTAIRSGLKVVMTLHEYFISCPNGAFYVYKDDEVCHRQPLSLDCLSCNCDSRSYSHKLWRYSRSMVQHHVLGIPAQVGNFILLSPLSRRIMEPHLPRRAKIHMLDNPISPANRGRALAEANQLFLFVGRFSREKGVLRFAEAVKDLGVPAVFVGDGHLREEIERLVPNATFTGWLNPEQVSEQMRRARVLVFPSTWYEGQPLVPIEAAANGIPSILSDCNAAVDYLVDGERGMHFKHNSLDDLKAKLRLAGNDDQIKRLSNNVYDWYWRDPWSLERHVDRLLSIYDSILAS